MGPKKKRPTIAQAVQPTKAPKAIGFVEPMLQKPSWQIGAMEFVDPFGWHLVDGDKLRQIQTRLIALERLTWREVLIRDNYWNHEVAKYRLSAAAQQRLEEIQQEDITHVVSLRLVQIERVWGIREDAVLRLLWWDPLHLVCPSLRD